MGLEKEELGLSLSLSSSVPRPPATFLLHAPERRFFDVPLLGAIGANGAAAAAATETDTSTVGKRSEREPLNSGDERASPRGISDEEDGGDGSRKKLRLSKNQSAVLEESFRDHPTLNPKQKLALANQLGLRPRQVEVWFQNRRARTKLKQTEVDCELLKRCCEKLTEENRRLQKEVQELRALKLISPQLYMQMSPPTTLTMCPSCERVSNSGAATTNRTTSVCHRPVAVRPPFLDAPPQHS